MMAMFHFLFPSIQYTVSFVLCRHSIQARTTPILEEMSAREEHNRVRQYCVRTYSKLPIIQASYYKDICLARTLGWDYVFTTVKTVLGGHAPVYGQVSEDHTVALKMRVKDTEDHYGDLKCPWLSMQDRF